MSPGPIEEGGKLATGVIEALKNQPVMLVLILMNLIFLGAIYFGVQSQRSQTHELVKLLIDKCAPAGKI